MDQPDGGVLSHAAFCYRGQPEYVAAIAAFIQAGLAAGEPALVAVPGAKARAIRDRLDDGPGEVVFTDMTELGRNPARIIPEVRAFADKHPGQRVRFVGEPAWPGRSVAEICEAARHEALINLAFAQTPITILCPYDASGLAGSVLAGAPIRSRRPARPVRLGGTTSPRSATARFTRRRRRRRSCPTTRTWRRCGGWPPAMPGAPGSPGTAPSTWSWP